MDEAIAPASVEHEEDLASGLPPGSPDSARFSPAGGQPGADTPPSECVHSVSGKTRMQEEQSSMDTSPAPAQARSAAIAHAAGQSLAPSLPGAENQDDLPGGFSTHELAAAPQPQLHVPT